MYIIVKYKNGQEIAYKNISEIRITIILISIVFKGQEMTKYIMPDDILSLEFV
jgi:hypothetical protein